MPKEKETGKFFDEPREIILIDKPAGMSSFDVIRALRKKFGARKFGHAGTLDPLASGLLLVAAGSATKKLKDLIGLPKTYEMEILLGRRTETGDMEGLSGVSRDNILEEKYVSEIDLSKIKQVLKSLEGETELDAPIYSALKVGGVPMYKLARRGEQVEPKKRKMKIYSLKLLAERPEGDFYILKVELHCGSGAYARSVAKEVGLRLGFPATVYSLRRTRVGDYKVEDAIVLENTRLPALSVQADGGQGK